MAGIRFLVYLTCFFLSQDLFFCDDYGESGNKITLTPVISGKPEEILWTLNSNKVLDYDGSEITIFGSFKDRVELDFETGQLTIRKLNSQDSGIYRSEILINKKAHFSRHTLTVLDALPEPRVTCELNETSKFKKLSCSVESQTELSYEWIGPGVKQQGPTLLVNKREENGNSVYTCTVKNKAGSRTTDFDLQDCHTGGVSLAVLLPVLMIIVLILLVVLAFFLYKCKKQKLRKSERENMDIENGECDKLVTNVTMEPIPGSLEATLPCRTRLTAPKESIADKSWDQHNESENAGETHEEEKLLKESLQTVITEKNKEAEGNTKEGELKINCENADEAEENVNGKADESEEIQKSRNTQKEMVESQILKNESEKESSEKQTLGEQNTKDVNINEEDQTSEEKKEKEEEDNYNKAEEIANSKADEKEEIHKSLQTQEEMEESKILKNESEVEEESSKEQTHKLEEQDMDINEEDQTSEEKKETEEEIHPNTAEESANSKADEREEIHKSLQTQEEMEESKILKNEGDEKESPEETETPEEQEAKDADTYKGGQTPEKKKDEEEDNEDMDSHNTVDTGDVAEQPHKNKKSSQNENGDQSIEQQNKSLSGNEGNQRPEEEKKREEQEKTEKENHENHENHEGTGGLHTAESCNPPLHSEALSDPVDSPSKLDISVPSSNLNVDLENKQDAFPQKQDVGDGEDDDESEQGMKEKMNVPEIKETKNYLLKD